MADDNRYGRGSDRDRDRWGGRWSDRDEGRYSGRQQHDEDRGFFERAADEVRSWFGDEDADRRRHVDARNDPEHTRHFHGRPEQEERWGGRSQYGSQYGSSWGQSQTGSYGGFAPGVSRRDHPQSWGEAQDNIHDAHYRSWREEQMRQLDRDYEEFRRQRQENFNREFDEWRRSRQTQAGGMGMSLMSRIREHMEVVGSDGQHVGTVDHVLGDSIKLTRQDPSAQGHHHMIPMTWVASVDDKIRLDHSSEEVRRQWIDVDQQSMR